MKIEARVRLEAASPEVMKLWGAANHSDAAQAGHIQNLWNDTNNLAHFKALVDEFAAEVSKAERSMGSGLEQSYRNGYRMLNKLRAFLKSRSTTADAIQHKKEPPPQKRQLEELRKSKKNADPKEKANIQLNIDRLKTAEDQQKKNNLVNKLNKEGVA